MHFMYLKEYEECQADWLAFKLFNLIQVYLTFAKCLDPGFRVKLRLILKKMGINLHLLPLHLFMFLLCYKRIGTWYQQILKTRSIIFFDHRCFLLGQAFLILRQWNGPILFEKNWFYCFICLYPALKAGIWFIVMASEVFCSQLEVKHKNTPYLL